MSLDTASFRYKQHKVTYYKQGKGIHKLLFIHGLGLQSLIWHPLCTLLQEHCTCYLLDIPGSGESAFIEGMLMADYASLISTIIEKENLTKVHLIGHSFGGYISLAFAKKNSSLLHSLALFHSTAYKDTEDRISTRRQVIQIAKEKKQSSFFFEQLIPKQFSTENQALFADTIEVLVAHSRQILPEALIQYQEAMIHREDSRIFMSHTLLPILMIHGKEDTFLAKEDIFEQIASVQHGSLHVLQQTAHLGMLEETALGARFFRSFLEDFT